MTAEDINKGLVRINTQMVESYQKVSEAFRVTLKILVEQNPDNSTLREVESELDHHDVQMEKLEKALRDFQKE